MSEFDLVTQLMILMSHQPASPNTSGEMVAGGEHFHGSQIDNDDAVTLTVEEAENRLSSVLSSSGLCLFHPPQLQYGNEAWCHFLRAQAHMVTPCPGMAPLGDNLTAFLLAQASG